MAFLIRQIDTSCYSSSIATTMAVSFTVFEIKQNIDRKTPIFHAPFI